MTTPYFLALQNNFHQIEVALFNNTDLLGMHAISKIEASSDLILTIKELLNTHHLTFKNLSFIAANQGPGPFTTLRVVIATVNGISFAARTPLVGVDGLDAFLDEHKNENYPVTVALLNAFNHDTYFGIEALGMRETGCKNAEQLIKDLKQRYEGKSIRFIGSGTELFKGHIITTLGEQAYLPRPNPDQSSIKAIGLQALQKWHAQKDIRYQLLPLYLKNQVVKS